MLYTHGLSVGGRSRFGTELGRSFHGNIGAQGTGVRHRRRTTTHGQDSVGCRQPIARGDPLIRGPITLAHGASLWVRFVRHPQDSCRFPRKFSCRPHNFRENRTQQAIKEGLGNQGIPTGRVKGRKGGDLPTRRMFYGSHKLPPMLHSTKPTRVNSLRIGTAMCPPNSTLSGHARSGDSTGLTTTPRELSRTATINPTRGRRR